MKSTQKQWIFTLIDESLLLKSGLILRIEKSLVILVKTYR